ncbi:laccase domain-containing protein [Psychrobacter sp. ANT_H56B]|uniref:polyphenol oxidase family protein n=1 Tax=Psychrobacter sp. ANT_H56B TaxID=2597353 RepID=UPI0011F0D79D|nr:polyphenol oxidase family protein [Psychrobacter sp. ANT_H56B]KAA0926151.1 laccase domain-containing protein [Psychrobacter sp. ANT_H56B]
MKNTLPMTLLAQLDDVAVFQTAAFSDIDYASIDISQSKINQQPHQRQQASYGELNLGLHVNDDASVVLSNRMRVLATINEQMIAQQNLPVHSMPVKALHWVNQVHGNHIHDTDATVLSMAPMAADAMVSKQDGTGLAIMTADCVPIVLYQPATGQIAAIHAGWQGLACGVIKATAERFSDSGQIMAWIGVCISQDNYEVGSQVRDKLLAGCIANNALTTDAISNFNERYVMVSGTSELDAASTADKLSDNTPVYAEKIKIDLPKIAADQLQAVGIVVCNESSNPCSYADGHYYSYRRQTHLQQAATGRMALIITRSASIYS